jgi:hypothetical protein
VARGVPIYWYADIGPEDERFAEAQMTPFLSDDGLKEVEARSCFLPAESRDRKASPTPRVFHGH